MDAVLAATRNQYDNSLTIEVTVFRLVKDSDGASMGYTDFHHETLCTVSQGGGGNSAFIQALLRQNALKSPGARTFCFSWDEDIKDKDELIFGWDLPDPPPSSLNRYLVGKVHNDDPRRHGLQVEAELQIVNPNSL